MTHPTARGLTRSALVLALLTMLSAPRVVAASSITISTATVGGVVVTGGGPDTLTSSASAGGGNHRADAQTNPHRGLQGTDDMRAGARALTNTFNQVARATAEMSDTWSCPSPGICGVLPTPDMPLQFLAHISFDGVLDPLIVDLVNGIDGTDESSLEVFFQYQFEGGTFSFGACYEPGNAFDRAESGCITPIYATFERGGHPTLDLTSRLVFGNGGAVSFNESLDWQLTNGSFDDRLELITSIRSNDSEVPHILDFFNTFYVAQLSSDPNMPFRSALGRTSVGAVTAVPEPASVVLLLTGLGALGTRRRRVM
jgi:hypothetical protein